MTEEQRYIEEISMNFSKYIYNINMLDACGYFSANIFAEQFLRELLNTVFDYHLSNLNSGSENEVAVDLGDEQKEISIQITSNCTSQKVRDTIKCFVDDEKYLKYKRLVIFQITDKNKIRTSFENDTKGLIEFENKNDIWNFTTILKALKDINIDKLEKVYQCVVRYCNEKAFIPQLIEKQICEMDKTFIRRKLILPDEYESSNFGFCKGLDFLDIIVSTSHIVIYNDAAVGKTIAAKMFCNQINDTFKASFAFYFRLNVYEGVPIEKLIPNAYFNVPMSNLVMVLDGFDEIRKDMVSSFINNLENFANRTPECRIVITSRSNFYNRCHDKFGGTIENFSEYMLSPISAEDIECFINKQEINSKYFWKQISDQRYSQLINSPFYLDKMMKLFKRNGVLPKKKSLMKEIIEDSFFWDGKKYRDIAYISEMDSVYKLLQVIAISLECLGRNYISDIEYKKLIQQKEQRQLIEHCLLWNKNSENIWSFEHNNFGEYLAAEYLTKLPLEVIKSTITYKSNAMVIKSSWLNAISFLAEIIEDKSFIEWIFEIKPEMAGQFESDLITYERKYIMFYNIFENHESKKIWLEDNRGIANFYESKEMITYLCSKIEENRHFTVVGNAISLLMSVNSLYAEEKRVAQVMINVCTSSKYRNYEKYHALSVMGIHCIGDSALLDDISKSNINNEDAYLRAGYYSFCYQLNIVDENIMFILDRSRYTNYALSSSWGDNDDEDINLADETINFDRCIEQIISVETLKTVVTYISDNQSYRECEHILKALLKAVKKVYALDKRTLEIIIKLLKNYDEYWNNEIISEIVNCIDELKIREEIFIQLINEDKICGNSLYYMLVNDTCLKKFNDSYYSGIYDNELARKILQTVKHELPEYQKLVDLFEERTGTIIPKITNIDSKKIRKFNYMKYLDAIFCRGDFIVLFCEYLSCFDKELITKKYISEHYCSYSAERSDFHRIQYLLLSGAKDEKIIDCHFFDNTEWNFLVLSETYNMIKEEKVEISEEQILKLKQICFDYLIQADFRNAIKYTAPNRWTRNLLCTYLWYFRNKFEWIYPENIMLDMLEFDEWEGKKYVGIGYITYQISVVLVKQRILENINCRDIRDAVFDNHIRYCIDNRIDLCVEIIAQVLMDQERSVSDRKMAVKYLLEFVSLSEFLEKYIDSIIGENYWELLEVVVELEKEKMVPYLESQLVNVESESEKLSYSRFLIQNNSCMGLSFYYECMKINRKVYEDIHAYKSIDELIATVSNEQAIDLLVKIVELTYEPDFKDDRFRSVASSAQKALISIGSKHNDNYVLIFSKVKNLIESRSDLPNIGFCNYVLRDLNDAYLKETEGDISIDDVTRDLQELIRYEKKAISYNWLT